eukprot:1147132-Pelagomonas_calceolata.AAC.4
MVNQYCEDATATCATLFCFQDEKSRAMHLYGYGAGPSVSTQTSPGTGIKGHRKALKAAH